MKSIAFAITDLDVGGAERTLVELACRLDPSRFRVSVLSLQPAGPLADRLRERSIPVDSLEMRSAFDVPRSLLRWRKQLRRDRPDLLVTFLFHANLLGRIAGRWAGVPRIVSGLRVAERRYRWPGWLDRWTCRLVDRHACVSEGVRQFTHREVGIPLDSLVVIPNGVDLEKARQARPVDLSDLAIPATARVLAAVGRLDPQKGLLDLLDAVALARRNTPANDLVVVLVGDGPLRDTIDRRIVELGLQSCVRRVGWQPNPLDWMSAASGLVLASHWEGMPNVVLEAMSVGLPVIATNVEGAVDLVVDGETGWLVPPADPQRLAEAILRWYRDPESARRFGIAGRERVEQHFSLETMVRQYDALFTELADSKTTRAR